MGIPGSTTSTTNSNHNIPAPFIIALMNLYQKYAKHWKYKHLFLVARTITSIMFVMGLIIISAMDALNVKKIWKAFASILMAMTFTALTVYWQFVLYAINSDSYIINIGIFYFSLKQIIISGSRISTIFFWKQAIVAIFTFRSDKCVLIKYVPSIKWNTQRKKHDKKQQITDSIQVANSSVIMDKKPVAVNIEEDDLMFQIQSKRTDHNDSETDSDSSTKL